MSDSMRKRVARAIAERSEPGVWDEMSPRWQRAYVKDAIAAIEAMREPTETMVLSVSTAIGEGYDKYRQAVPQEKLENYAPRDVARGWQAKPAIKALIDAALEG